MYHRFVRTKKPDSHSAEKEDSPVSLGLAAYTRNQPTMEDIMLYQAHRLTPIPSALLSKAAPIKSNEILVDNMADLDQASSPDISQYCDIDFDNISPPANINFDDELDEEIFASLAIPKVLVPPTEADQQQQHNKMESPVPKYSNLLLDIPSSINLEENQTNHQTNITESEPTNNSIQAQKQHKKHKKDGRKKKEKKKKIEQEVQEVKEMEEKVKKEMEEVKEAEEAKEAKELKKKKRKKKKKKEERSKNKDQKDSTDYTATICDPTQPDFPIFNHSTITVDRNPYPVWSSKYSTNMCSTSDQADTTQTPTSTIPTTAAGKTPVQISWQKSVKKKPAVSPKHPDPSTLDEFEAVHYQYNDLTNVLTPTLESWTPSLKERGDLIKEVAQEVCSYFNHPTIASTAGIGAKKSHHRLTRPQENPPEQQKRDIESIINKYCPQNKDSQMHYPKAPKTPKEVSQDSSILVDNSNTPVRKFGRIIHCNPTVHLTSTLMPTPPKNTINPHPPASCLTSSKTPHPPQANDEVSPAMQPHPPPSKPQPSGSQCPSASASGQRRPPAHQRPPTSRPRPPTAKQITLNFKPQPPTPNQCPTTSKPRPPTANQRPPTSRPQPPTANHRPPSSRPRPPTAHQHPPTSKQRPPSAKPQPQSPSHHPPVGKMILLQSQKSDYHLIQDEAQLPQLSPSQVEPEESLYNFSLKPSPPTLRQHANTELYRAKIARRLKNGQPGGRVLERRGHQF